LVLKNRRECPGMMSVTEANLRGRDKKL